MADRDLNLTAAPDAAGGISPSEMGNVMDKKIKNVESVRFLFSIMIVYFHILHANILPYVGSIAVYEVFAGYSQNAEYIVECFFIIGGYFLFRSMQSKPGLSGKRFIMDKVVRLGPVLWLAIIIGVLLFSSNIYISIFQGLFLQCMGISLAYQGTNWYVSAFFWGSIFVFALMKLLKGRRAVFVLAVLVYFSYVININYTGGLFGRETICYFLSLGLLRAIGGLGLGYLIGYALEEFYASRWWKKFRQSSIPSLLSFRVGRFAVFSVLEIAAAAVLLITWFYYPLAYDNLFIVVIMFAVLFFCMIFDGGILSKILDNPVTSWLGRFSYSIYVMQGVCFSILMRTLWRNTPLLEEHPVYAVGLSVLFCVGVGIAVYYLVERPSIRLYRKMKAWAHS